MSVDCDPKGFYRRLGVDASADAERIRAAYRHLAKKLHPDVNRDLNAKALFQAITEAYEVLSDPDNRAAYDASSYSKTPPAAQEEFEPICCSRCGKVTAQPRSTVFFRVISMLVATTKTPIQGIFCSPCARRLGFQASLLSGLFGWWGVPWGPIWTIGSILENARGGRHSKQIDEKLLWYNAVAFFSKGNFAISYALARQARRATDEEIALGALKLMDQMKAAGLPPSTGTLKDPWHIQPGNFAAHLLMLLFVPAGIAILIYSDDARQSANRLTDGQVHLASRQNLGNGQGNIVPSYPVPPTSATASTLPTCLTPPLNGQILEGRIATAQKGHVIEIQNGSNGDAIVKVRNADTGRLAVSFFVAKGQSSSIKNLPDGDYLIQYALGGALKSDCRSFARAAAASQFPDIEPLQTSYTQTQIVRSRLSYTLYSVPNGNVRPQGLSVDAFEAD